MNARTPGSAGANKLLVWRGLIYACLGELLFSTSSRKLKENLSSKRSKQISSVRLAADEVGILKRQLLSALDMANKAAVWKRFKQLFKAAQGLAELPVTEAIGQRASLLSQYLTPDDLAVLVEEGLVDEAFQPTPDATEWLEGIRKKSMTVPTLESIEILLKVAY